MAENIETSIEKEMQSSYIDYAMSVIIGRALPDVRDGLKPAHRRTLYAMYMLNNTHNQPTKKSAKNSRRDNRKLPSPRRPGCL